MSSGCEPRREGVPGASATLSALLRANVRFWTSVAAPVRGELAGWAQPARAIGDPALRRLALAKLHDEGFNAEVAATLATLAPRRERPAAVRAIVALELLFDYLDGRTERELGDPIEDGLRLYGAFTDAVAPAQTSPLEVASGGLEGLPDGRYLAALRETVRENLGSLRGGEVVAPIAHAAAERCAQAQTRLHAATALGDRQLQAWAREHSRGSDLQWREHLAGCASSVLALHALIAAAADPRTTAQDARRIDHAYLAIGGVVTILDSIVDRRADALRGERGFVRLFADDRDLYDSLRALIGEALARSKEAPNGAHHVMTLAGIAAFYTTHPGARDPRARELARVVRRELSPTIWPALTVMHAWRSAKSLRLGTIGANRRNRRGTCAGDRGRG